MELDTRHKSQIIGCKMFYNPTNENATKIVPLFLLALCFLTTGGYLGILSQRIPKIQCTITITVYSVRHAWLTHELCFTGTTYQMESFSLPVLYVDLKDRSIPVVQDTHEPQFHANISKNGKL